MSIRDSFPLYVWAFPCNVPASQLAWELLFRCHGNEKWELMEWWISISGRISIKAGSLGELLFSAGGTRGGSDLCLFLRPFSGINMMSLMKIAFFILSLARSSGGLSSHWECWMCLWECSWPDIGLVRVHLGQCCGSPWYFGFSLSADLQVIVVCVWTVGQVINTEVSKVLVSDSSSWGPTWSIPAGLCAYSKENLAEGQEK